MSVLHLGLLPGVVFRVGHDAAETFVANAVYQGMYEQEWMPTT